MGQVNGTYVTSSTIPLPYSPRRGVTYKTVASSLPAPAFVDTLWQGHAYAPGSEGISRASVPVAPTIVYRNNNPAAHLPAMEEAADQEKAQSVHSAFVFIKPHANTASVRALVSEAFRERGIRVVSEGAISAETIDEHMLIDTHYGAIAAKAVKLKPEELTVQQKAQQAFLDAFDLSWDEALMQGYVYNAMDACAALGIGADELAERWGELQKDVDLLKFGGGFYCGRIEDIFVINAFYMNMRAKFTKPGTSIYRFLVEWDIDSLSWSDFRGSVLGATDPRSAARGSIRNDIFNNWQDLGLNSCPDTGDNGVHASASPFEALAERANWCGQDIAYDFFGQALMREGVSLSTIREWCEDPAVTFEGKSQSLFDLLEDLDGPDCLVRCGAIASENS